MAYKSNSNSSWFYPYSGTGYFLTHPRYWWLQLFAMLILTVLLLALFAGVLLWTFPNVHQPFWPVFWGILKSVGYASCSALVGFIVLMPLLLTLALDKMVRRMLQESNAQFKSVGFFKSVYSSTVIFFKTFFWRLFWPVVGIIGALFFGPIGAFVAQVGIGHLAVIDGVDLTLALMGFDTRYRIDKYKELRGQIFKMGFSAGCLSMLLSITILGWLIWVPGVIAGCALWVMSMNLKPNEAA